MQLRIHRRQIPRFSAVIDALDKAGFAPQWDDDATWLTCPLHSLADLPRLAQALEGHKIEWPEKDGS